MKPLHRPLARLLAGTAIMLGGASANAQTVPPTPVSPDDSSADVVVTGSRYRAEAEIKAKRAADVVSDSLSADDIGAVPDFNIADALRRIPGVSTVFDEDEGRFVAIRGIDPSLNIVTLDGISLPSSGDFGGTARAVNLEFLPSTTVKRLQVFKTFTPDIDGGSVGGQVNLITRSAFDKPGFALTAKATASHYALTGVRGDNALPLRGEVTASTRFGADKQFGILVTGLYSIRPRDQIKYFSVGALAGFPNIVPADRFNVSLFGNDQRRFGANGKLEYKSGGTYAFLSGYWYKQQEAETRYVNNLQIRAAETTETSPTTGRVSQAVNNITNDYFPIATTGRGGQFLLDQAIGRRGKLVATVGYGEQVFRHDTPAVAFATPRNAALGFTFDTSELIQTRSAVNNPTYFATPTNYTATLARFRNLYTIEGLFDAKLGYSWNADAGADGFGFKVGSEYRRLRRMRDNEQFDLSAADRARLLLADFLAPQTATTTYQPEPFLYIDTDRVRNLFTTATLVRDPAASSSADFVYRENIVAGYAAGTFTRPDFKLIAGARYEKTDFSADAAGQLGTVRSAFDNWLPSVNARYNLARNFIVRAAYSRTLGRPNPGDLAATTTVTPAATDAAVALIVRRGNPDLKPRQSDNFDLSAEYYFSGNDGILSLALFSKNIRGDIFTLRTLGEFEGQSAEFRQNINAVGSQVRGLELNASLAHMRFLPGALSGFGASVNLTFIEGSMEIPTQAATGNNLALTTTRLDYRLNQPTFLANAALFYSYRGFEGRIVYNRTGQFKTSLTQAEAAYSQVDASVRYTALKNLILSVEGRNLLGADRTQLTNANDFNFLFGRTEISPSFHFAATLRY